VQLAVLGAKQDACENLDVCPRRDSTRDDAKLL
jgi:hypothetical protein